MLEVTPTKQTYDGLDGAYSYFNGALFGGRLPSCLITVRPNRGAYGYFSPERFGARDGDEVCDEIALNMKHFKHRTPRQTLSTLVHEMVHLEQHHFGKPSRGSYHNKQWADWMQRIGLHPSNTGEPGGKRTGQRVSHYVVEDGPFDLAFSAREFTIPYFDRQGETEATRKKRKVTYTCPECESKATGKPDLHLHCGDCGMAAMTPSGGPDAIVATASYDTKMAA